MDGMVNNMNPTQTQSGVDMDALNLTHAIALSESKGKDGSPDYNAKGASGEKGAYQWMPGNFESGAKAAGLDPNDFSPENQDKVAYAQVKEYKDKGYQPHQIASLWNSGSPNNYLEHSGTNAEGVKYDTPAYVAKVKENYQQLIGQGSQTQQPQALGASQETPQPDQSLGSELSGRVSDASSAVSDTLSGKINPVSGVLQTAGAVAGGLGDVVNKGLELIPGVKQVENLIGQGAGVLLKTPTGQAVAKSISDFTQVHPELSKDIGAGFNIVTAIPILEGLGAVKNLAMDGISTALKGVAEKSMTKDLTEIASRTIGGKTILNDTPNVVKTLINERAIPDIVNGKLTTKEAYLKLGQGISDIEDNKLQPLLKSVSSTGVDTRRPLEELRQQALKSIESELKSTGQVSKAKVEVNRIFDDYKNSYGDYATLSDINDMKRGIRTSVNFNSPKLDSDVSYHIGQVFQKDIESSASKLGLPDVGKINQQMSDLIKAQKILKFLDNKPIKNGLIGGMIKNSATVGGEALGNMTGIPIAGALTGRSVGGNIGRKLTSGVEGILKRTGKDAVRLSKEELAKKLGGLFGGAVTQKMTH